MELFNYCNINFKSIFYVRRNNQWSTFLVYAKCIISKLHTITDNCKKLNKDLIICIDIWISKLIYYQCILVSTINIIKVCI